MNGRSVPAPFVPPDGRRNPRGFFRGGRFELLQRRGVQGLCAGHSGSGAQRRAVRPPDAAAAPGLRRCGLCRVYERAGPDGGDKVNSKNKLFKIKFILEKLINNH